MGRVTAIVAYDEKRGIGKNQTIPWQIKEEMAHFKNTTMGHPVIMGRRTWDSIPSKYKPLPGRSNIVVSSMYVFTPRASDELATFQEGVHWVSDIEDAISLAENWPGNDEIFLIGGAQIYHDAVMCWADRILASEIKGDYEADTFFPELTDEWGPWVPTLLSEHEQFKVVEYLRSPPFAKATNAR